MRGFRTFSLLPTIIVVIVAHSVRLGAQVALPATVIPVAIALSATGDNFRVGSPIPVVITLTNISAANVAYEWESPESAYKNFRFVLTVDGGQVPKTIFHRKIRGDQLPDDPLGTFSGKSIFVTLSPRQSVQFTVDVEKLYTITQPGSYALVVDRTDDLNKIKLQSQPLRLIVTH
jgi:hypothetical protein